LSKFKFQLCITKIQLLQPRKPRFTGRFFTWSVLDSTSTAQLLQERRLLVFSSGRRSTVLKYLLLKFLWDTLSREEYYLLLHLPEFFKDPKFISVVRLTNEGKITRKTLRARLIQIEKLLNEEPSTKERYLGYKKYGLDIRKVVREVRPAKKYSGYVRSIASLGKGSAQKIQFPEPITNDGIYADENELDWYNLLTVVEIPFFSRSAILTQPDESYGDETDA